MKKIYLALCFSIALSAQNIAYSLPVTVVGDPQAAIQHGIELAEMIKQLEQQITLYKSLHGSRGLANVIHSVYDASVQVDPQQTLQAQGLHNAEHHKLNNEVANLYDQGNENAAVWSGQSEKSLQQTLARFQELSKLVEKVNESDDPKDVLDLQARISAEQVFMQNEIAKLQLLESQSKANQAIHDQKIKQMAIESAGELREVSW
ncbi:MAG: type IV secretion system protein [Pseudomonadota bacterium]